MHFLRSRLAACIDLVFPPRADELAIRDTTSQTLASLVEPRLAPGAECPITALLPFRDGRVRALMHEAKYHGNPAAFDLLGDVLSEYLLGLEDEEGFGTAVLVPVPLSRARLRARGYNQAEEITARAARATGIGLKTDLLVRTRDTASQTNLTRLERKRNMREAFGLAHVPDPSSTYIVFDDVVTTGATLEAAAAALRAAGATRILLLALAH